MNDPDRGNRCAHPICACTVDAGERFCSDHCRDAMQHPHPGTDGERCLCGHRACAAGEQG